MGLFAPLKALAQSIVLLTRGQCFQHLTGVTPKVVMRPGCNQKSAKGAEAQLNQGKFVSHLSESLLVVGVLLTCFYLEEKRMYMKSCFTEQKEKKNSTKGEHNYFEICLLFH